MWPDLNFRDLPLSLGARNQFAGIYEAVRANGVRKARSELLAMITEHAYAPDKGTYMPVSEHTYLQASCPASGKMWAARVQRASLTADIVVIPRPARAASWLTNLRPRLSSLQRSSAR